MIISCEKSSKDLLNPAPPWGSLGIPSQMKVLGLPRGHLKVGCAWKTSSRRRPEGTLFRCPDHLKWFLLTRRSSGHTPSSLLMSELITRSLKLSLATLRSLLDRLPPHHDGRSTAHHLSISHCSKVWSCYYSTSHTGLHPCLTD